MPYSQNLLSRKYKYLFGLITLLFITAICVSFSSTSDHGFNGAKREILLRSIGHELLLQSGDSTSRVLPVKMINENEYQIQFEKDFSFQPDTLVSATKRIFSKDSQTIDYVVTVLNSDNNVVYGYTISKNEKEENIPCRGRLLPKAKYIINIKFKPSVVSIPESAYFLGSLPFLAFIGFVFFKSVKSQKSTDEIFKGDLLVCGAMQFDAKNRQLTINEKTIELTSTESRLLHIFVLSPNKTIERSRLQKEIWEDEGIIVGRSLDMFISKLRKKLDVNPNINIVVVRSKGYKLEIDI